jgi:LacI family transcriptional regulator
MQALGALRAIDEAGLLVPDDIAVLGFDDVSISQYVGLSTLRQPLHDFGTLAIEKVVARLNDPDRTISSTVFNPELVVRDTCGGDGGS